MKKCLAINGGPKSVSIQQPHFSWPIIGKEEIEAVNAYLKEGKPISIDGRKGIYEELEEKFIKYHGVNYALATSSGTAALHSAFFALGIKPSDEVIAPTYTFLATIMPIFHCGGIPILCDAEEDTGNIDAKKIGDLVTKKTKAIAVTHMWGHPVDINEVKKIADQHSLCLIEDFSHALGAEYQGKKVGTFGDVSCVSLQANKIVTAGEGGMLLTSDREIYERALLFGHYRSRLSQEIKSEFYKRFVDTGYGLKLRMHPLGAVIASVQFDKLDMWNNMRNENLSYLTQKLQKTIGIKTPATKNYVTKRGWYTYKPQYFPKELDSLSIELYIEALRAEGVDIHKPDSKPLHLLKFFQTQNDGMYGYTKKLYKQGDFPKSEKYFDRLLSLPSFTLPCKPLLDQYADAFKKVSENVSELIH